MKILYNANVITMKNESERFSAIGVEGSKITELGDSSLLAVYPNAEAIDMEGKTIMPGLIDPHSHFGMVSKFSIFETIAPPPLGDVSSHQDIVNKLKARAMEANSDETIIAIGYDHEQLEEGSHPTRQILDEISTEVPIIVMHASLHVGSMNTCALIKCGVYDSEGDPEGGRVHRDENGVPTGFLEETAIQVPVMKAFPKLNPEVLKAMLEKGQEMYTSQGITTVQDGLTTNSDIDLFKFACSDNTVDIDVHCYPPVVDGETNNLVNGKLGIYLGERVNNFKFSGYKMILDGSPQARTAWLSTPYCQETEEDSVDYCAYPTYNDDSKVIAGLKRAVCDNAQILVHCNGDAAADQLLRCFRRVLSECNIDKYEKRVVMIHCQTTRKDQLEQMKELNIIPAMFPIHTYFWGDVHYKNLGYERASQISNMRYSYDLGLMPTAHEDSPVLPPSPLFSVWSSTERKTRSNRVLGKENRISRYEAFRAITYNAAYQYFEEDVRGTLEIGKVADMAVFDMDVMTINDVRTAKVVETIKNGKTIYKI